MDKFCLDYLNTGLKICSNCNIEKPVDSFYFKSGYKHLNRRRSYCKLCMNSNKKCESGRKEYKKNKEIRTKEYRRRYYYTRKDKVRDTRLKHKYGITLDDFNIMLKEQNGVCKICKGEQIKYKNSNLCVDHCHDTGKIRGILCDKCNLTLGLVNDRIELLRRSIDYLKDSTPTCGTCSRFCGNDWCSAKKNKSKQLKPSDSESERPRKDQK